MSDRMNYAAREIMEEGKFAGIKTIERDIDERKKAGHQTKILEIAIESSISAFTLTDLKGILTYVNESFVNLWWYEKEEALGRSITDLFQEGVFTEVLMGLRNVGSWVGELGALRKDGAPFEVQLSASVVKDDDGIPLCMMASMVDITGHKEAERSLIEYTAHLREIVEERTRELMDAERMVAAGRVSAMVGHDLRGPLQTIKNVAFLLKLDPDNEDELIDTINGAVDYAVKMLDELRQATKDTPLNLVEANLESLIEKAVEEASAPSNVSVELNIGRGLNNVSIDPVKIRRILDNLIRNSLEAMPGGGLLTIVAVREEGQVRLKVSDTGVGIPVESRPHLYEPFNTTKSKGLGLGLAYCKRAVDLHGGMITVMSEEGRGTTFEIILPTNHVREDVPF